MTPPRLAPAPDYRAAQQRISGLVAGLGDDELDRAVPATPRWTVRDLVAHLTGVAGDVVGQHMEGAPGDEWTAAHVESRKGRPLAAVLDEWEQHTADVERLLAEAPLPVGMIMVADVVAHEHDLRGALGRPGARDERVVAALAGLFLRGVAGRLDDAGLPAVRVRVGGEERVVGSGEPGVTVEVDGWFELLRGLSGRRTEAELRRWRWDGDPSPYLPVLSVFPFPEAPLSE